MSPERLRLFLSYGRVDAKDLADRLAAELAAIGHDAWQDTSEIRGGAAWTAQIVEGLRTSRAVMAILSPHSVRSRAAGAPDDSVCLDEIAIARFDARIPIVPIMAVAPPCPVPFEIYRLHYVDFSRWKESDAAFSAAFEQLRQGLALALDNQPRLRNWVGHLEPYDFGDYLAERRASFTGRQWLFEEIDAWRRSVQGSSMLLTGPPGIGKTAFVAELIHRNPANSILAYHCCRADSPETLQAGRFVRSVAAMMAARLPAYAAELAGGRLSEDLGETSVNRDPETAFEKCVLEVLRHIAPADDDPCMIVIDGLDETLPSRGAPRGTPAMPSILSILQSRMARLPAWLRVLATARREQAVLEAFSGMKLRRLDPRGRANADDIRQFARASLESPGPAERARREGWDPGEAAEALAKRAAGNFLYVSLAIKAITEGRAAPAELEGIPPDLPGIYQWFFARRFPDGSWAGVQPLFQVLNAARDEMAAADLSAALGCSESATMGLVDAASPFLRDAAEEPRTYSLYHRSLGEWLAAASTYSAKPADGHRIIADGYWSQYDYDVESLTPYALRHLGAHLEQCTRAQDSRLRQACIERLARFALDPSVQLRLEDEPADAHQNLQLALSAATEGPPVRTALLALGIAAGLVRFRRERLNPARLFEMAERGDLDRFEKELGLYEPEDPWRDAARLISAWLARDVNRDAAEALRKKPTGAATLRARVDAAFEGAPPLPETPVPAVDEAAAAAILAQLGGMDLEGRHSAAHVEAHSQPPPGREHGDEGTVYFAEQHAPVLVAFARRFPEPGTRLLKDYISLQAANGYRTYRNESLWRMVPAVLSHPDERWVLDILRTLAAGALAGRGREFSEAALIAVSAIRAAIDPARLPDFEGRIGAAQAAAASLRHRRGEGDAWGEHRRRFAVLAECLAVAHRDSARALGLLDAALGLPEGFAGFQASSSLDLAESFRICGGAPDRVSAALRESRLAAHNIQDATFCARTTARCNALIDEWWDPARWPADGRALRDLVTRFTREKGGAEFSAVHYVGWKYDGRRPDWRSMPLPSWLTGADTLPALASAYQRPVEGFERLNPENKSPSVRNGFRIVRVPDNHFGAWLAARFSAEALAVPGLPREERLRVILRVLPAACASPTVLDKVLARLLLALLPKEPATLDEIERRLEESFAAPPGSGVGLTLRSGPA